MATRRASVKFWVAVSVAVGVAVLSATGLGRPQDNQQPSQGPGSNAGQTVYAPKKSKPGEQPVPSPNTPTQPSFPAEVKKPEKINPSSIYTLSTTANLVNVNVLVTDNNGNPIPSLQKNNFRIYDDGVQQTVTNFSTAEAPMTVCMLVEFSNEWWPFIELALQYSYQFLQFIQPQDWTAVIDFDLQPHILQDFTQDKYQVRSALDTLRIPGFSEDNLYDALSFTLNRMEKIQGRKAILVVCTGFDTFSKLTYGEMLKIVRSSNTPIYPVSTLEFVTVRTGNDSIDALQARNALTTFAKYSGGQAYFPRFDGELPDIYQQIAGQLRHEYSLGFIPTDSSQDGKFHKLKVDLVDAQGNPLKIVNQKGKNVKYKIVSRDGYYATKSST
jgi:Ca-activated chloride channel homolog